MKKIAVIGSINMDLTATAERHPKKGETVSGDNLQYLPGGKGANQAVAAARLGGDVSLFGCVGDDVFADRLLTGLNENGVDTSAIRRVPNVSSGIAMITVAEGDNTIVVIPGANRAVTPSYLDEVKDAILSADILILQNEIPMETVLHAIDMGSKAGKVILYNPAPFAPLPDGVMEKISYLTPNEHEATLLFPGEDLPRLLQRFNGKLIVTLGKDGALAWSDGNPIRIPPRPAKVVDTTGAGDTFCGAFAYALSDDFPMEQALRFANTAASLSTEGYGAQSSMPSLAQVLAEVPSGNIGSVKYFPDI